MILRKDFVRTSVAVIVIFGHLAVFISALTLGVFSLLGGTDAIQTLLMATPVLSTTALAAFSDVIARGDSVSQPENPKVSALYTILAIIFPLILLALIFIIFYLFWIQLDGFGPDQLKISLGCLETFFGIYLGAIAKSLFTTSTQGSGSAK